MGKRLKLSASQEDYLETICHIVSDKKVARVKDIAEKMGVTSASVTGALRSLAERKLVNYTPYDVVTLTPAGESVAREIIKRHGALKDFFRRVLFVDEAAAEDCACKMEHIISDEVIERFVCFAELMAACPCGTLLWQADKHSFVFEEGTSL